MSPGDANTGVVYNSPGTAGSAAFVPSIRRGGGAIAANTILVVEDDDTTRDGFGVVLSEHGYQVALAGTGQDALTYLQTHDPPGLILLDMFMPGMDGWLFLKLWQKRWRCVPVLIATALRIGSDEWAKSLGACGLLEKPVDPTDLLEEVRKSLRPDESVRS